jgi:hypothetical protein
LYGTSRNVRAPSDTSSVDAARDVRLRSTVADVLERSRLESVAAAPSPLREQLARELKAPARLLRHR